MRLFCFLFVLSSLFYSTIFAQLDSEIFLINTELCTNTIKAVIGEAEVVILSGEHATLFTLGSCGEIKQSKNYEN